MNVVRYVQLRREVEFLCDAALDAASRLDHSSPTDREAPYLAQSLIHLSLKIAYLIWRFGRRMTDRYGAEEADQLRAALGLDDASPLSPGQISALVDLITIDDESLVRAFHFESLSIQAGGALRPLRPIVAALEQLSAGLASTQEPAGA
jgi:hypothetical protein